MYSGANRIRRSIAGPGFATGMTDSTTIVGVSHRIEARAPAGAVTEPPTVTDPDRLRLVAEDAAHVSGHAAALVLPATEGEVAAVLRRAAAVLPIGAQSSLTGGATPRGDVVLGTSRFRGVARVSDHFVRVGAGVSIEELDTALRGVNAYYPPAPTYSGAFVGGTVATNAAGAATFKYGTTRDWVHAITVVLPTGDVIDVEREATRADANGDFRFVLSGGVVDVRVPRYRMPGVPKVSAGYFAAPGMDLVDLFVGAEGTLGVITEVTLRISSPRPAWCLAFVPCRTRAEGMALVRALRAAARAAWSMCDRRGVDVSAIEHFDARCLALAREDGLDRRAGLRWPDSTEMALLVALEMDGRSTPDEAFAEIAAAYDEDHDGRLARFCRLLASADGVDDVQLAVPGDAARAAQLIAFREEVPGAVNRRVGLAKQRIDARIEKTAADMIVPFERIEEFLRRSERELHARNLDAAVWGHISDGNLHVNVLPGSFADVERGREAIVEMGRVAVEMGGSPLAEHGVGRSPIKQQLVELLYGRDGVEEMRAVKRALDPECKLAPGVLIPAARP